MPSMIIQDIVDRAAAQADMDGNFVQPEQWLSWYGTESRALVTFLSRNNYLNMATGVTVVDYDATSGTITSPEATLALIAVFEVRDNKYRRLRLRPWQDLALNLGDLESRQQSGSAAFYSVVQSSDNQLVVLDPFPSSGTYKGVFLRDPYLLNSTLSDSVSWPLGFEEWIVLRLAKRALIKENSDTSQVDDLLIIEERRIEEQCWQFALRDGNKVRNVDNTERGWGTWDDNMALGSWDSWHWL